MELIFIGKSWFNIPDNAENVTANNKKWMAVPKKVTVLANTYIEQNNAVVSTDTQMDVVGASNRFYLLTGHLPYTGEYGSYSQTFSESAPLVLNKNQVTNVKWG